MSVECSLEMKVEGGENDDARDAPHFAHGAHRNPEPRRPPAKYLLCADGYNDTYGKMTRFALIMQLIYIAAEAGAIWTGFAWLTTCRL